jgi:hypothetical protein
MRREPNWPTRSPTSARRGALTPFSWRFPETRLSPWRSSPAGKSMSILNFLKSQAWRSSMGGERLRDTLSIRWPDEDREVKRGAQLIVRESQVVQFVYLGQFGDTSAPQT